MNEIKVQVKRTTGYLLKWNGKEGACTSPTSEEYAIVVCSTKRGVPL